MMNSNRRKILKSAASVPFWGMVPSLAEAQTNSGYKALVCIRLEGGNDGYNTVVPLDAQRYSKYSSVRGPLSLQRGSSDQALAELPGSGFGLHPVLRRLVPAWNEGALTVVHNVGPLSRPITQQEFISWQDSGDTRLVPQSLYSHSDQGFLWDNADGSAMQPLGWGGLAADQTDFNQVISLSTLTRFGMNRKGGALVLPYSGATMIRVSDSQLSTLKSLATARTPNALQDAYSQRLNMALEVNKSFSPLLQLPLGAAGIAAAINSSFTGMSTSSLTKQLFQVAKIIDARGMLGGSRHIFYVQLGGFDTHGQQVSGSAHAGTHAELLAQVGEGMSMFWEAMKKLGLANQVTMFTTSDFGRTFKPNSSLGTDHGWGNEQLILGGGVKGGNTYGSFPDLTLGGPNDAGDPRLSSNSNIGRWIPTTSVDQMAAPLVSWWNPGSNIDAVLPNLGKFASRDLGFMKV
jgi:uncharacterized protein (DUF1501 family)